MITADNITDEQIRELREWAGVNGQTRVVDDCFMALGEWGVFWESAVPEFRIHASIKARARCAEILNARGGK